MVFKLPFLGVLALSVVFVTRAGASATDSPLSQTIDDATRNCDTALPPPLGNRPRVKIELKTTEMIFGDRNKVPIDLHGQTLRDVSVSWDSLWGVITPVENLALHRDKDGRTFVEVIPKGIGKLKLDLGFVFEDCAIDEQRADVNVRSPERGPDKLTLTWTNWRYVRKTGTAHLDFADYSSVVLTPLAYYSGVDAPVPVYSDEVAFTIITRKNEASPITFDPSFRGVHSMKLGQALVKAKFRGRSAYTCIDVMQDARFASGGSDCHDFLPSDSAQTPEQPVHSSDPRVNERSVANVSGR